MTIYLNRKPGSRVNYSDAQKQYALDMHRNGFSYQYIAVEIGAPNEEAVRHVIKRMRQKIVTLPAIDSVIG